MDCLNHLNPWLELMDRPAFCVKNGFIVAVNSAASRHMLQIGLDIHEIVTEHCEEYESFSGGCLYLAITVAGLSYNCSVTRTREYDIFLINQESDEDQLQALALAAQQLRIPLSNIMTVTDRLLAELDKDDSPAQQQANQISHSLFQLLRIIGNMSDAGSYRKISSSGMQTVDLSAVISEIMEKAQTVAESAGISLQFSGLNTPVFGLANSEKLERAIYNLLSNAFKFAEPGTCVEAKLTRSEKTLSFLVCNTSLETADTLPFWNRYQRKPTIEDCRYGLGLGMTLVSAVAIAHGGTVLVDHPAENLTRVTMSIAIVNDENTVIHSPVFRIGDYAGGRDKGLLELSEILPAEFYQNSI